MDIHNIPAEILEKAKKIRLLVLDVDGVLSDGKLYFSNSGNEIKAFNSLDGHGIKMLQKSGVRVAIITGRTSHIVQQRAQNLGVDLLQQGREDKLTALEELLSNPSLPSLSFDEIAHMGDDYPDLPLIRRVGLGLTTANAHWVVKQHSHWQSDFQGGEGAVRQACDLIMLAQDSFENALEPYL